MKEKYHSNGSKRERLKQSRKCVVAQTSPLTPAICLPGLAAQVSSKCYMLNTVPDVVTAKYWKATVASSCMNPGGKIGPSTWLYGCALDEHVCAKPIVRPLV